MEKIIFQVYIESLPLNVFVNLNKSGKMQIFLLILNYDKKVLFFSPILERKIIA